MIESPEALLHPAAIAVVALPALAFFFLGFAQLVGIPLTEKITRRVVAVSLSSSVAATALVGVLMLVTHQPAVRVVLGNWFEAGEYAFEVGFTIDPLSLAMMFLVTTLTGLIGRFSLPYLHREPGFQRFFTLLCLFATGMLVLTMATSIDLLFVGWELVGLTSALLVAFFQERDTPVNAGVRVFIVYRVCDIGLLVGAVLLHQAAATSEIQPGVSAIAEHAHLPSLAPTLLPLCFLLAAMGKSAQFPFGSWLPRAMEGPTPSSAIFYGALSVHAGVYLLIRAQPLFASSAIATTALIWVGATTALHGGLVARVQTDVKSALAFATMTQVGLMLVEIGLGLVTFAALHLVAHALLRTLQLLRAPSALRDARSRVAAGVPLRHEGRLTPAWIYRLALDRFGLETLHERLIVVPLLSLGQLLDRVDRRWVRWVSELGAPPAQVVNALAKSKANARRGRS